MVQAAFVLPSLAPVDKARHYEVQPYPALGEYHVTHRPRLFLDKTVLAPLVFGFLNSSNTPSPPDGEDLSPVSLIAAEGTIPRSAEERSGPAFPVDESTPAKEPVTPLAHRTNSITRSSNSPWSDIPKRVASSSNWKGFTCRSPKGQKSSKSTPEKKDQVSNRSTPPTSAGSTPEKADTGHKEEISYGIVGTTECSDKNLDFAENLKLVESSKDCTGVQNGTEAESGDKRSAIGFAEKQKPQHSIPMTHHEEQELPAGAASTVGGSSESSNPMNDIAESDQAREVSAKCQSPSLANKVEQGPLGSRYCMRASELAFAEESFSLSLNTTPKKTVSALLKEKTASINAGTTQSSAKSSAPASWGLDPVDRSMSESPADASTSKKGMKTISLKKQKADTRKAKKAVKEGKSRKNGQTGDQIDLETSSPVTASDFLEPVTKKQQLAAKVAKDAAQDKKFSAGDESSGQVSLEQSSPLSASKSASAVERATHEQVTVSEKAEESNNGAFGNNDRSIDQAIPEPATSALMSKASPVVKRLTNKQKREGKKERKRKAKEGGHLSTAAQPSKNADPEQALLIPDSDDSPAQQSTVLVKPAAVVDLVAAADATQSLENSTPVAEMPFMTLEKPDTAVEDTSTIQDPLLSQSVGQPPQHKQNYKAGKQVQARKAKAAQLSPNISTAGPAQLNEETLHDAIVPTGKLIESVLPVAHDQLDSAGGDTQPCIDKGNGPSSEASTEILTPSPSQGVSDTKQMGCHESDVISAFDDGSNEKPTILVITTSTDDHSSQGVVHSTGHTTLELQPSSESAGPTSEREPFPDFNQAACDNEFPSRPLPEGGLSMGKLKAWMDEEDDSVRGTEDLPVVDNSVPSNDHAIAGIPAECEDHLIEDLAPSKDFVPNDEFVEDVNNSQIGNQPVASDNIPSIADTTQTTNTSQIATHGGLHTESDIGSGAILGFDGDIPEEMEIGVSETNEIDSSQGNLEDHRDDSIVQDPFEEDISEPEAPSLELTVSGAPIEDVDPPHASTQQGFHNPNCLLFPGEISWFSETMAMRASGDFDLSELADASEAPFATEENATEATATALDQLNLLDEPGIDGTTNAQDQTAFSEEILTQGRANAQDQRNMTATENAVHKQDRSSLPETATESADTDSSDEAVVQRHREHDMLENREITEAIAYSPQPPAEALIPISPPETLEEQHTPALGGQEGCGLVEAAPTSPQPPAEVQPIVVPEPLTVEATPTEDRPVEHITEEVSVEKLPVEDMPFEDAPGHALIEAESSMAAAPTDAPQPPVENPSPVAPPENTTNQDTSATSVQNLGMVSALDTVNIVDVATALEQHPDDKFLLLSLILLLIARFTMLLLSGIGLRRRV